MKKETKLLRAKALQSLLLSIELFNRPSDNGRAHSVLILLDHAFEMLFKSIIVHRHGAIKGDKPGQTIGFQGCVQKGVSEARVKFLSQDQALTAQMINSLRDAAQHHLLDISEQHLYIQAQAALTLFRDIFRDCFGEELKTHLPARVVPLSTTAPIDLATLFDQETAEVRRLLQPGSRKRADANSKMRALAIVERSLSGHNDLPTDDELHQLGAEIIGGQKTWDQIFREVATISFTTNGHGPSIDLRISKAANGLQVTLVPEGTPGATTIAVRRVNELGYYSMGRDELARNLQLNGPMTTAYIRFLNLKNDPDSFKVIEIGHSRFNRYSQKAAQAIRTAMTTHPPAGVWESHGPRRGRGRARA